MEATKRAIRFQFNEIKRSILIFLFVVLIVDIFSIIMSQISDISIGINIDGFTDESNMISLMALNILPIIVYLIVFNYESYYKSFPLALNFSMIRKDFFKSMVLNNIILVSVLAVIQAILMKIDPIIVKFIGKDPVYDFKAFNIQTDSLIFIIMYFFIAFLLLQTIWNLIAALNYKFGSKMWIALGIITFISINLFKTNILSELLLPGNWLNMRLDIGRLLIASIIVLLVYIGIYFISINTDVKNKA